MMRILADEQLAGRLHIRPHMVIPGSEVLTAETRRRIEVAWGNPPFNAYGGFCCEKSDASVDRRREATSYNQKLWIGLRKRGGVSSQV
jgi:hypothetical protein